jgi:transglutaminase-like putative cysteine protease
VFLFIKHLTELSYTAPISETVMELRMTPKSTQHQVLRGQRIDVAPRATPFEHLDWLGNRVHQFSIVPAHDRIYILARSAVETEPKLPELGAVTDAVGPPRGDPRLLDFCRFTPLVADCDALGELAGALGLPQAPNAGALVERILRGLRDHVTYRKGVTTSATALPEVLRHQAGVCQDLAHVAVGLCRRSGLAARYVSGYFYKSEGASELESHAWCEVHVPSVGWLGLDPTHRVLSGEGHVATAVGRDFSDVAPNRGVYRGDATEKLSVKVSIQRVEELPEGLLTAAPTELPADAVTLRVPLRAHAEEIEYQQEQQQQ